MKNPKKANQKFKKEKKKPVNLAKPKNEAEKREKKNDAFDTKALNRLS